MALFITITAFSVIIPFLVGVVYRKHLSAELMPIVLLCGLGLLAEVYCYVLRVYGISNVHVSYILTPLETYLYMAFFFHVSHLFSHKRALIVVAIVSALALADYILLKGSLNTLSLSAEFMIITSLCIYTYLRESRYSLLILTILFSTLTSFPYFFAYEWLRVTNVQALIYLSYVFAVTHSACYLIIAYVIWKHSSSSAVRSSYRR